MKSSPQSTTANHRILIIDDNPAIHEDFRKILGPVDESLVGDLDEDEAALFGDAPEASQQSNFEIDSAMQGQEGLKMLECAIAEGRQYAAAFVDIRMPPGWDGVETIQHLWKCDPNLQVVICTAYSDFSWEQITERLGATDKLLILKKPFDNVEVLQFAHALTEKWQLNRLASLRMEELDELVRERTAALQAANERLSLEVQERILIEAALRVSEKRFSKAFNASPIAMAIISRKGHRFVDANDSFSAMLGWQRADVLTEDLTSLPMWNDHESFSVFLARLETEPYISALSCALKTKAGEARDGCITVEPFDLDGVPHILLLIEDVTARAQMEATMRRSEKMEAFGQLAAGVAHDFNNILTVIRGHVSLQLASSHLHGNQRTSLSQVLAASERASSLTRQLLSFTRRQVTRPRPMRLNGVIEDLGEMVKRVLGEQVVLEINCPVDLPAIHGDPGAIEVVVMNLAANARDAMPDGGTLRIEATPVTLTDDDRARHPEGRAGNFVRLSISDTGCGMTPEVLARVFEPFFTTKEVGKGTGLGLAAVYGVVRQHESWIEAKSEPGLGSTFDVFFPSSEEAVETPVALELDTSLPLGGNETILAVEDEPALRDLVQFILESAGYRVMMAEDGRSALKLFGEHSDEVDLLLTDMIMPGGITGRDLATQLREQKPGLRVVFTSGYSAELMGDTPQSNVIDFLQKPYEPDTLLRFVRTSLNDCAACA